MFCHDERKQPGMKIGIGISSNPVAWEAGQEAARQALCGSGAAVLGILLITDQYEPRAVLASVRSALGGAKIVGACTAGIFSADECLEQGVGILTLAGEGLTATTVLENYADGDAWIAGLRLGQQLLAAGQQQGTLICFPDGLTGNITRLLEGLYNAAGPDFVYGGGGTGDNLRFLRTCQLTEQDVSAHAVAAALLQGVTMAEGVAHGWEAAGAPLIVTNAKGKIVYELDGRPAFEVYSERLGGVTPDRFADFAMRYPLGVSYGFGQFVIRDPLRLMPDRSMEFVTEVPNRAVAYIMKPRADRDFELATELTHRTLANLAAVPRFALVNYCVSRSLLLGPGYRDEIRALLRPLGSGFPVLGSLAFGEIGSYYQVPQVHNKSIGLLVGG